MGSNEIKWAYIQKVLSILDLFDFIHSRCIRSNLLGALVKMEHIKTKLTK